MFRLLFKDVKTILDDLIAVNKCYVHIEKIQKNKMLIKLFFDVKIIGNTKQLKCKVPCVLPGKNLFLSCLV